MRETNGFAPDLSAQGPAKDICGWVLAGGESSRMGAEKSALPFGEQLLLQIAVAKASSISNNVAILCGKEPHRANGLAPAILDVRPPCGPLGGIEAALLQTDAEWNFFIAVDTPLIPLPLLRSWKEYILRHKNAGVAFLVDHKRIQTLPLLLRKETLPLVSASLNAGNYRLREEVEAAAKGLGMTVLCVEVDRLSLKGLSDEQRQARAEWFGNANTPAEIERMRRFADTLKSTE